MYEAHQEDALARLPLADVDTKSDWLFALHDAGSVVE